MSDQDEDPTADIHVMPNLPPTSPHAHICSVSCWCEPELGYVNEATGRKVWVHREVQ